MGGPKLYGRCEKAETNMDEREERYSPSAGTMSVDNVPITTALTPSCLSNS